MKIKLRSMFNLARKKSLLIQLFLLVFMIQMIIPFNPLMLNSVSASPATYPDIVWIDIDGDGNDDNDNPANAYNLGFESRSNDPTKPLNVSTIDPDFYNFTANPGFYFQVSIEFDQTIAYNSTGQLIFQTDNNPVSDIDLELYASNGALLGESKGKWGEEIIGPILINTSEILMINVTAVKSIWGEPFDYSITYNMSIIFDDIWELQASNDRISLLDDPSDGFTDDEILPGTHYNLSFSNDIYTTHGKSDWYIIWLYNNTWTTLKVTSYTNQYNLESNGPDLILVDRLTNTTLFTYTDPNGATDAKTFRINSTGWYYLGLDNSPYQDASYYILTIDIEDNPEYSEGDFNQVKTSATKIVKGNYYGMVISSGDADWYKIEVKGEERIRVEIIWFNELINDINLTLFVNDSDSSIVDKVFDLATGDKLKSGLWTNYRALVDSWYHIYISSDNMNPLYYQMNLIIQDVDDIFEDNDNFGQAVELSADNHTFIPTFDDPWAGLFSLKNDGDFFKMFLLSNDVINVSIDFNGLDGDLDLYIYNIGEFEILSSELAGSNTERIYYRIPATSYYYFVVIGKTGSYKTIGLDYNMTVTLLEFDDYFEANDDIIQSKPIGEGNYTNLILRDTDNDYYYVYLAQNDNITISLTYFSHLEMFNDIDLYLLYADESLATKSTTQHNETLPFTATISGKYYIVCLIFTAFDGGSNYYNLTIDIVETDDLYEDNDNLKQATRLNIVSTPINQTIHYIQNNLVIRVADDDFYVTKIPAGLAIIVEITFVSGENLDLELIYPNTTIFESSVQQNSIYESVGPLAINLIYLNIFNSSDVYFRVFMKEGLRTTYSLNITIGPEEILITRETVPPFTPATTSAFDWFGTLVLWGGAAAVLGGATAGGLYFAKKTGRLDKGISWIKDKIGKGDSDGGE